MKIEFDFISDIHLDFWVNELNPQKPKFKKEIKKFIEEVLKPKTNNILILGGDQGHYFNQDSEILIQLLTYYKHIIIVAGNHDMYLLGNSQKKRYLLNSENRLLEMRRFCSEHEGLHYLNGKVIVIDGIRIGGVGMWHDDSYGLSLGEPLGKIHDSWKTIMNDSNKIYSNGKDIYNMSLPYTGYVKMPSFDPVKYFNQEYEKLRKIESVHIMVTHYGPKIPKNLPDEYKNIVTSFFYFDGLTEIERIKPKFWIHGHTHSEIDEIYKGSNIICNPLGYPSENTYNEIQTRSV